MLDKTTIAEVDEYKEHAAALLRDPDDASALVNQFVLMARKSSKALPGHLALTKRAWLLAPEDFRAVLNYASALNRAGQIHAALTRYAEALTLARKTKDEAMTSYNIGMCWHDLGDMDRAIEWYDKAIALSDRRFYRHGHAVARLAKGDLSALFDFEVKWHAPNKKPIGASKIPRWAGEDLTGKTLIVCHEQGFGDSLHFCRLIPRLKALCGRLIWSGPPIFNGLIADNFDVEIIDEAGPFLADFYCSPISAGGALGLDYREVSGEPYMVSLPMNLPDRGQLKIGLAWAGSPTYGRDSNRSMALKDLCPLLDLPGAAFYSFQVRPGGAEISHEGLDGLVANLETMLTDWRATARAITAMDVMVCVDTGTAHLAGALGKPVALLLGSQPCWRWRNEGSSTPWYANHQLFRQAKHGDWTGPVMAVRQWLSTKLN